MYNCDEAEADLISDFEETYLYLIKKIEYVRAEQSLDRL